MGGLLSHSFLKAFVTGQAHVGRLRQQQFAEFRLMGTMAFRAKTILHGFMAAFGCLKRFVRFRVAFQAEGGLAFQNHPVNIACMRVVAPQALAFRERRMNGIIGDLLHELAVTLFAEFRSRGLEQFCLVRSMGIVTGETLAALHRLVHDPFLKFRLRVGMAGVTHFIGPVFHQTGHIRPVGTMAGGALLLGERRMLVLEFQRSLYFFMTREAKAPALRNEQMVVLRGMGQMARETALSAFDGRMGENDLLPFFRVAAETEFVPALHEEFRVLGGMGVVTLGAHAVLEGRVLFVAPRLEIVERMALLAETAHVLLF